jgi:transcriptional regulator with XRE-family HTH domain
MNLRDLRAQRGLTLEATGILGGVDPATVSRIERGLVKAKPDTTVRLARALGVSAGRMKQILAAPTTLPGTGDGDTAA